MTWWQIALAVACLIAFVVLLAGALLNSRAPNDDGKDA